MKNLRKVFRYIKPYKGLAVLNVLYNILSVLFSLVSLTMIVPFLSVLFETGNKADISGVQPTLEFSLDSIKNYFNYTVGTLIREHDKLEALLFICLLVVVMFFLKNLFRYLAMYYLAPIRNGVVRDIRNEIFFKILILPLSYYSDQRKGDIMARMTSDVQEVEWSIMSSLEMVFREPISIIAFLVSLFVISPELTIFVLVMLPIAGLLIGFVGKSLKRTSAKVQVRMGYILSAIEETISGLRIIKGFNAIWFTEARFKETNEDYTKLAVRMYRKRDLASPLSEFLGALVIVVVLWFGGRLVLADTGGLKAEVFIMYIVLFSQLLPPAKSLVAAYYNIQKGVASAERIEEILKAEEKILEKPEAIAKKDFNDKIEYNNVCFSYDGETQVLKNINLTIEKGKTIALVGPSGGGKSTMADLLPRFYDTVSGDVKIDGRPITDYVISDVRGLMGIVTQESILFNDTVFNNIAFGLEGVTEQQVIEAARIANAHEFIEKMDNGYYTNIGDRGTKLSGGQRQRISIARAVLRNQPIMILDEATSALDTESERLVQDAINKLMQNRTSVVIAHRLSTIQHADEIVVLQHGEIVERGKHHELLSKNGVYKRLYDMQSFV